MDALKETRFAVALEGARRSIRKGSCVRPGTVSRRTGKTLTRFLSVAKYYPVVPVPTEPVPEKAGEKKSGKGWKTKEATVLPEPRIAGFAWIRNVRREERNLLTGPYVIETSHTDRASRDIWSLYTTLTRVEEVFRDLKSALGIRPVFQQKADRWAHLFISILAYFLLSNIEHRLRWKGETISWKTVRSLLAPSAEPPSRGGTPHTGFDYRIRMTSKAEPEDRGILDKCGIKSLLRRIVSCFRPQKKEGQEPSSGSST